MMGQISPLDYLKFETYYFIYLIRFPDIATISLDNPSALNPQIRKLLQDPQTVGSIRNWGRVYRQIMDQVRPA